MSRSWNIHSAGRPHLKLNISISHAVTAAVSLKYKKGQRVNVIIAALLWNKAATVITLYNQ